MSVIPTMSKEVNHSSCELRFLELEAGLKKHEKFLQIVESHAKQLDEVKTMLVRILCYFLDSNLFLNLINNKKGLSEGGALNTKKLEQVKNEFRGFASLHGFSTVLKTSKPFVKCLRVCFFLVLFACCIQNVFENINSYYQYTVITKIENVNEYPMALPALTLCLAYDTYPLNSTTLKMSLLNCSIGGIECDHTDFYSFETRTMYRKGTITCYVLNGGRNSSGHFNKIQSAKIQGSSSGFVLQFYLPKDQFFFYYINDAYIKPIMSEINKYFLTGTSNEFILDKTVETKLDYPFNNCWNLVNLPDTPLVRQLSAANITYRQANCFELCFRNFVQKYAFEHDISEDEARLKDEVKNYDREMNCNKLCPLECESTQFRISESKFTFLEYIEYSLPLIPVVEKRLNITINSTKELSKNILEITVFFDSLKYTKISQTPKTTLSALVSNLGGSTGLFLELSFLS